MLSPNHKDYLRKAIVTAFIQEKEDKYASSTAEGPLGIGCDPHAEIMSMYIIPYLPNYAAYKNADEADPMLAEDEAVIMHFQEQAWDYMMKVEQEILDELLTHLKKQFGFVPK